jgi:8-oxo-dGTP diphosphatase
MGKDYFKLIPAVYLFLRKDNEVLLLRRANTGYQDGKYSVPAGHIEGGELATAAMHREAKEEVGITVQTSDLKFVHVTHRLNDSREQERVDFFFEALKWQGEVTNVEPNKCDDLTWFPIDNLPDDIIPHVRLVLEKVLKGEHYSEYESEP